MPGSDIRPAPAQVSGTLLAVITVLPSCCYPQGLVLARNGVNDGFRHPSLPPWPMRLQAYRYSRLGVEKKRQTGHFSSEISVTLHQDTCSVTSGAGVHVRAGERAGQPKRPHSARVLSAEVWCCTEIWGPYSYTRTPRSTDFPS